MIRVLSIRDEKDEKHHIKQDRVHTLILPRELWIRRKAHHQYKHKSIATNNTDPVLRFLRMLSAARYPMVRTAQ